MVEQLTDEQLAEFRKEFNLFDKDRDGTITATELGIAMRSYGIHPSEVELKELIDGVDTDGSGSVEFDEFVYLMAQTLKETDHEELLRRAFRVFDKDHLGFISAKEIHRVMICLGEKFTDQEVENMIQQADTDGDGQINYEEFLKLMMSK